MNSNKNHWDPQSEDTLNDQIKAYDKMRKKCPIAHSDYLNWSVFKHADVLNILNDHHTFSNQVSSYLSVPNGMDLPEHAVYRQIIEPYFNDEAMQAFAPTCQAIAEALCLNLGGALEITEHFAEQFSVNVQTAFMGWPESLREPLLEWTQEQHQATLHNDREKLKKMANAFDGYILEQIQLRQDLTDHPIDITYRLMREKVYDRFLTNEELISLIRNWTVGELSTITACITIILHFLAENQKIQRMLREQPELRSQAIDEILRIYPPLISNRRISTKETQIGGQTLAKGSHLSILWASANRDEAVFPNPDEFDLTRDPKDNLLYGAGIHVCPGAPLARLELNIMLDEVFKHTHGWQLVENHQPQHAHYPASGFSELWLDFY